MKTKTKNTNKNTKTMNTKAKNTKPARAEKGSGREAFAYDAAKDVVVKELGILETGTRAGDIVVRVVSYDGGAKKLLIARTGTNKAGESWFTPKLGRLTGDEVAALLPLITKAQKYLD